MSPAELRTILDGLHLPQVRAAKLLGVHDRTVRNWLQGRDAIPVLVARIMRLAAAGRFDLGILETA